MANWVRFADTKATILSAALGVMVTVLVSNTTAIVASFRVGTGAAIAVGFLALVGVGSFVAALEGVITAVTSRSTATGPPNRFSWPLLSKTTTEELGHHLRNTTAGDDAWDQVLVLSRVAEVKYAACNRATVWFAVFTGATVLIVILAAVLG